MLKKFGGNRACSSEDMIAYRQTQTDRHAPHNTPLPYRGRFNSRRRHPAVFTRYNRSYNSLRRANEHRSVRPTGCQTKLVYSRNLTSNRSVELLSGRLSNRLYNRLHRVNTPLEMCRVLERVGLDKTQSVL